MGQSLIKGMLGDDATRCAPPCQPVAWACFVLGESVDTGGDMLVHAGDRGAVA
jgi:hypothetical protein